MNDYISPGHHILLLDKKGNIAVRTRHHSGAEVEEALLAADPQEQILCIGKHKLAQVRRIDQDGTIIILAQYLDHMEEILESQLISRGITAAATAFVIIFLIYLVLNYWVIKPVTNLVTAAREWADRNFAARSTPTGPSDLHLLAEEFNSMAAQLERHEHNLTAELEQANQIQAKLLPTTQPNVPGLVVATEYRPAAHVAGDLYDIFKLPDGKTAIVIMDVCGHSISAALLTGVVKMSLHRRLAENDDLCVSMKLVNKDLLDCMPVGQFVTACVGIWDQKGRTWTYCGAGYHAGELLSHGKIKSLAATAPLLGVLTDDVAWKTEKISLSVGDRVFLYTDGVIEAGTPDNRLKISGLQKTLNSLADSSITEQVKSTMSQVIQHDAGIVKDDATIVAFEVLGHHSS